MGIPRRRLEGRVGYLAPLPTLLFSHGGSTVRHSHTHQCINLDAQRKGLMLNGTWLQRTSSNKT